MSMFNTPFNAEEVDTSDSYDALPPGQYEAVIISHETKQTKAGTGQYLELAMQVISGPHENRRIWDRLNLDNPNEKAVEIAKKKFAQAVQACGYTVINDESDLDKLVDVPIGIVVKYQRMRDGSGKWVDDTSQTQVTAFKAIGGDSPKTTKATPPPQARAARGSKPSWATQ